MERFIYASSRSGQTDQSGFSDDFKAIAAKATHNNRLHQLSGFLICTPQWYAQVLEGPSHELGSLFANLLADRRHFDVQVLERHACERRLFPEWGIGWKHQTIANRIMFLEHGLAQDYAPSRSQVQQLLKLSLSLAAHDQGEDTELRKRLRAPPAAPSGDPAFPPPSRGSRRTSHRRDPPQHS